MTQKVIVLGGGAIGLEIASELTESGQNVTLTDGEATASRAREAGLATSEASLDTANSAVGRAEATVVIATPSDARNLMLGAKARRAFGVERVLALVHDPDRREAFEDADIETICVSGTVARTTVDALAVEDPPRSIRSTETSDRVRLGG